ncbi:ABC transporter ATP-binding protein [Pseudonocardia sp. CA-107938]|uniref:ABC transporter ATP-binding protein n=1 Tax=Pseudonocardia sp. CA-107938 TaxID=3240021 RepID=UPI003D8A1AC7
MPADTVPAARSAAAEAVPGEPVLRVADLRVGFAGAGREVLAVDGVDLALAPGRVHALVGESGSGKSVTGLTVLGLTRGAGTRISGRVEYEGRDLLTLDEETLRGLRGAELAMIFQDPMASLNPLHRVGRQIAESVRLHAGSSRRVAADRAVELLDEVGIADPQRAAQAYPHEFSGGMRQRVMIAIALACSPKVLIADEPTTALDVTVQAQILRLLRDLCRRRGTAVLLVTHDLGVVAQYADEVSVMYVGEIVERGTAREVLRAPAHPYTRGLLAAVPRMHGPRPARLPTVPGSVPVLDARPTGCRFVDRCAHAHEQCSTRPPVRQHRAGHTARCWLDAPSTREAGNA